MELLEANLKNDDYNSNQYNNKPIKKIVKKDKIKNEIKVSSPIGTKTNKHYAPILENENSDLKGNNQKKLKMNENSKVNKVEVIKQKGNIKDTKDNKSPINNDKSKFNNKLEDEKIEIIPAQIIQFKTKQVPNQVIISSKPKEGLQTLNDKLKNEINKMKVESDEEEEIKETINNDDNKSINSDDRNFDDFLDKEPKQNVRSTTSNISPIGEIKQINNKNSNNILKKYFGIQAKSNEVINHGNDIVLEKEIDHKQAERDRFALIADEKLKELNKEINKVKTENEKVAKLKNDFERHSNKLSNEIDEHNNAKETERKIFESWKDEEKTKFQKEKRLHEKNLKALINMPNRKEREEIENFKLQLQKLSEDSKKKDQNNKLTLDRLKKQLEDSNSKNIELAKEVKFMDELKMKNWGIISLNLDKNKISKSGNTITNNGNHNNNINTNNSSKLLNNVSNNIGKIII